MAKESLPPEDADASDAGEASQETLNVTDQPSEKVTKLVTDPGSLLGSAAMPEVQEHAVREAREDRQSAAAPTSSGGTSSGAPVKGKTDFKGREFDPALHEVDDAGKPVLNRDGYLKCYRGRASSGVSDTPARPANRSKCDPTGGKGQPAGAPAAPSPDLDAQIDASASAFSGLFFTGATLVGGDEFAPEPAEADGIKGAFAQYFRAKGCIDLPPGAILGGALVCYVAKRWNAPKFAARRENWLDKGKRWLNDFRYRRQLQAEKAAKLAE